jgi:hypothetical protein
MILKSGVGAYANTFVLLIVGAYFGSNCPRSLSQNTAVREQVSSPQAIQPPAIIYRGPIIDVHLHTDPPLSSMGVSRIRSRAQSQLRRPPN